MSNSIGLIVAVIILILLYQTTQTAGFTVVNKNQIIDDIIENKDLFYREQFSKLKSKLSWMDAGIYADVRSLMRSGNFDRKNLEIIFRQKV
jgi:hypothetical protein